MSHYRRILEVHRRSQRAKQGLVRLMWPSLKTLNKFATTLSFCHQCFRMSQDLLQTFQTLIQGVQCKGEVYFYCQGKDYCCKLSTKVSFIIQSPCVSLQFVFNVLIGPVSVQYSEFQKQGQSQVHSELKEMEPRKEDSS